MITLQRAIEEYNDAVRMFNYANTPEDIDVAIALMYAADVKIRALKRVTVDFNSFEPISEVY